MKIFYILFFLILICASGFADDLKSDLATLQANAKDKVLHVEVNLDYNKKNYRLNYTGIISDAEKGYFFIPFSYRENNITNIKCWFNGIEYTCKVIEVDPKSKTLLAKAKGLLNAKVFPFELVPIKEYGAPLLVYATTGEDNFFRGIADKGYFLNYRFDKIDSILVGGINILINITPGAPIFNENFKIVGFVTDGKKDVNAIYDIKKNVEKMIRKYEKKKKASVDNESDEKPYLGFISQAINENYARYAGLPPSSIVVSIVHKNSPAEKAGIMPGDLITAINDISFLGTGNNVEEHFHKLMDPEVGQKVKLTILRNNKSLNIELAFEKLVEPKEFKSDFLGTQVSEITENDYYLYDLQSPQGIFIKSIVPGSPAATSSEFGSTLLSVRDIILEVEHKPIKTISDFSDVVQHILTDKNKTVLFKVLRGNSTKFIALKLNLKTK